jgi:ferritin-like metal-binding protein YciE
MNYGICIPQKNQLIKALPKLAQVPRTKHCSCYSRAHLEETKGQGRAPEAGFGVLDEKPAGEHYNGMEGVVEEGADALEKDEEGASFDSGIIGAALRPEHY